MCYGIKDSVVKISLSETGKILLSVGHAKEQFLNLSSFALIFLYIDEVFAEIKIQQNKGDKEMRRVLRISS